MGRQEFIKILKKASDKDLQRIEYKVIFPAIHKEYKKHAYSAIDHYAFAKGWFRINGLIIISEKRLLRALEGTGVVRVAQSSLARRKSKASRGGSNPLPSNNKKEGD